MYVDNGVVFVCVCAGLWLLDNDGVVCVCVCVCVQVCGY